MSGEFSLEGKHALVTGGTRGIGLAIAKGLAGAGAAVTICGRKPEGLQAAVASLVDSSSAQVQGVAAHVGKPEDRQRLVGEAEGRFGPVGILVNNAGTNPYFGPIIASEEWAWDKTMDVNLKAPYALSQLVAGKMIAAGNGGSIVNIASVAGFEAARMMGIYSVTKAGLIMLTKVMARELGGDRIRVNCICPGVIKTQLSRALWEGDAAREEAILARKALGRIGQPEELAGAVVYFASDASSFTTGAVLQIDGGMVI